MKVLICGGRNYNDKDKMLITLAALQLERGTKITKIIQGGAKGADLLAKNAGVEVIDLRDDQ